MSHTTPRFEPHASGGRYHRIAARLLPLAAAVTLACTAGNNNSTSPSAVGAQPALITVEGELNCLPHRPGFPTTFECTIGLRESADRHYALLNLKEGAGVGDRVRITGRFTPGARDPYDVVGTIDIETQVRLGGGA